MGNLKESVVPREALNNDNFTMIMDNQGRIKELTLQILSESEKKVRVLSGNFPVEDEKSIVEAAPMGLLEEIISLQESTHKALDRVSYWLDKI